MHGRSETGPPEAVEGAYGWVIAALLFLSILIMQMTYSILPPLFSEISRDITLSKAQMGLIFSMISLASIFFSLIGGAISDRFGSRLAIGGSLLSAGIFGGLRSLAGSALGLAVLTFMVGAAVALLLPNVVKVLAIRFSPRQLGKVNGLVLAAGPLGVGLGLATGAGVLSPAFGGWRGVMGAVAAACVATAAIWTFVYRDSTGDAGSRTASLDLLHSFGRVLSVRDVWLLAVYCGFFYFTVGGLISLLPIVFEERGVSHPGALVGLLMVAGIVGGPLGGLASDRAGKRAPFLAGSALLLALCTPLFASLTGAALVATIVVGGLAMGVIQPIMLAIPVQLRGIGPSLTATAVGLVMTVGGAVGALGPIVSGRLMDVSAFSMSAFIVMAAALAVGSGLILRVKT